MHSATMPTALRRSSRVPTAMQILVTSLEGAHFSEVCETVVVNAHGCAILSPLKLDRGVPLRFQTKQGRHTTAQVVSCQAVGPDNRTWRLGAQLSRPENFWGLSDCPKDWELKSPLSPAMQQAPSLATALTPQKDSRPSGLSPEALMDLVAQRLEAPMRRMIAESIGPLQTQIAALKETIARREANPSRFEVSLSCIPPELEQQLEARLKKDLGPKMLDESRQQNSHLLESAKVTIGQKIAEGHGEFLHRVTEELNVVEKRAKDISAKISTTADQHLQRGLEEFRQKLLEGGASLKRLGEELQDFLQHSLSDEHTARLEQLEGLRASVAAESTRLHKHIEYLDSRIAKLDETTRNMESGLDKRLGQMSGNTLKDARDQLESMGNSMLEQFIANGVKMLEDKLSEASANMAKVQREVITSVSQSLGTEAASSAQAFKQSMDEIAGLSLERWRLTMASRLTALAKSFGEQFQLAQDTNDSQKER